jgi:histidinol-phosphate aminotransferase
MNDRVAHVVAERERIVAAMSRLAVDVFPSGANFVLFRIRPGALDGRAVWQGLVDRSVLIRDCSSWPRLDDCLRVTIGTPEENSEFLAALADVLAGRAVATDSATNLAATNLAATNLAATNLDGVTR